MKRILFTGGGSAGHVVPNLALMRELRFSHELFYMGTGGIEQRLIGEAGFPFYRVDCPKLVRSFTLENFKIPHRLHRAKRDALEMVEKIKPDLVFSKGGFASFPAVWAAHRLRVPVLTHESDLSPGLCTRMIAGMCKYVLTSFPETAAKFKNGVYVGSPVRREIMGGDRARAMRKFGFRDRPVLLVFGGGSGSRALNEAVRGALPSLLVSFDILHICGRGNLMPDPPAGYVQREYEADMGGAYACADVVLSRAGSNTIFELLALKKPALLVPLSHASRGDQAQNAAYFEKKGLCRVLDERDLSSLPDTLRAVYLDEELKAALARCGVKSGTPRIIEIIKAVYGASGGASV